MSNYLLKTRVLATALLLSPTLALAEGTKITGNDLLDGILSTLLYGAIGLFMASIGFKVVDWLTPGDLAKQVTEDENRALAVLAGSMILGVCIIIAAVLMS